MHNNSNDYDNISERFLLNGQILIDEFADSFAETALFGKRRSLPADRCPFVSERNHFIRGLYLSCDCLTGYRRILSL